MEVYVKIILLCICNILKTTRERLFTQTDLGCLVVFRCQDRHTLDYREKDSYRGYQHVYLEYYEFLEL